MPKPYNSQRKQNKIMKIGILANICMGNLLVGCVLKIVRHPTFPTSHLSGNIRTSRMSDRLDVGQVLRTNFEGWREG